jgi:hypothetical protein
LSDSDKVIPGTGAWFYSQNGGSILLSGNVIKNGNIEFAETAYTMQSNPLPAPLNLSKVTTSGLIAQAWGDSKCARIMTLNKDGSYAFYYYINDAYTASDDPVDGDIWADVDGYELNGPIAEVGEAFWCYASQKGFISISQ